MQQIIKFFKLKEKKINFSLYFIWVAIFKYNNFFTILKTAKLLKNFKFVLVGGSGKELKDTKKYIEYNNIKNVKIKSWITMNRLPKLISNLIYYYYSLKKPSFL